MTITAWPSSPRPVHTTKPRRRAWRWVRPQQWRRGWGDERGVRVLACLLRRVRRPLLPGARGRVTSARTEERRPDGGLGGGGRGTRRPATTATFNFVRSSRSLSRARCRRDGVVLARRGGGRGGGHGRGRDRATCASCGRTSCSARRRTRRASCSTRRSPSGRTARHTRRRAPPALRLPPRPDGYIVVAINHNPIPYTTRRLDFRCDVACFGEPCNNLARWYEGARDAATLHKANAGQLDQVRGSGEERGTIW